jgi:hypothetical protein
MRDTIRVAAIKRSERKMILENIPLGRDIEWEYDQHNGKLRGRTISRSPKSSPFARCNLDLKKIEFSLLRDARRSITDLVDDPTTSSMEQKAEM